jgi:hypothetical protein
MIEATMITDTDTGIQASFNLGFIGKRSRMNTTWNNCIKPVQPCII